MAQKGEKGDVLCSVKPSYHADKENIDPCFEQQHSTGPGPSMFGMPSGKQQFSRATSSGKGRTPLADITALCLLQGGMPLKHQQAGGSALQKGLWSQPQPADKLGAASSGAASSSGHRLAAMR